MPCINLFNNGFNKATRIPPAIGTMVKIKKKVDRSYCSVTDSIIPPKEPASLLPMAMARYHIPNIKAGKKGRNAVHEFALAMGVNAYPTMVFFDEEGKFLSPLKGYLTPQKLEIFLKIFATNDYKKVTTEEDWKVYQDNFKNTFSD